MRKKDFRDAANYCFRLFGTSALCSLLEVFGLPPRLQLVLLTILPPMITFKKIIFGNNDILSDLDDYIKMVFSENLIYELTCAFMRADFSYSTSLQLSAGILGIVFSEVATSLENCEQNFPDVPARLNFPFYPSLSFP